MNVRSFQTEVSLPLQVTHLPQEYNLSKELPQSMDVTVRGKGMDLLYQSLRKNADTIHIDYKAYEASGVFESRSNLGVISMSLQKGLQAVAASPAEISLKHYEKDNRRLPVVLQLEYKLMESLRLSRPIDVQPDSVLVIGPPEKIAALKEWKTNPVTLEGTIKGDTTLFLPLSSDPPYQIVQKDLMITIDAEPYTSDRRQVQVEWKNLPQGAAPLLSQNWVYVDYLIPLRRYDEMKKAVLKVTVDYRSLQAGSDLVFPELETRPAGMEEISIEPAWLKCNVTVQ